MTRSTSTATARWGTLDLADRPVHELSGGQRQRVWTTMALAQGTALMLLDEPTTHLDLAHQVEGLDLLIDLNQREGRMIVLVLHDLNHAWRYAHHLIAMRGGVIVAEGPPDAIVTRGAGDRRVRGAGPNHHRPGVGDPMVVPIGRHLHVATEVEKRTWVMMQSPSLQTTTPVDPSAVGSRDP